MSSSTSLRLLASTLATCKEEQTLCFFGQVKHMLISALHVTSVDAKHHSEIELDIPAVYEQKS